MSPSDNEEITESGPPTGELRTHTTAELPVVTVPIDGAEADLAAGELEALFADEPDEWPTQGPAKGLRVRWPVAVLLVLLVAFAGIWGGAYLQRHSSNSTTAASSAFPGFAALRSRLGGSGAAGIPSSASSGVTAGTVTDIIGNTLYVTTASGSLVAVKVGSTTTVDRNAKSSLAALEPGDTVTVQGSKGSDGTVDAASVSATQKGVSSGFGGFGGIGGFGGGGAAAGGAPTGATSGSGG
jgi:hypothetical protein